MGSAQPTYDDSRPEFENPPLAQVSVSVQYAEIPFQVADGFFFWGQHATDGIRWLPPQVIGDQPSLTDDFSKAVSFDPASQRANAATPRTVSMLSEDLKWQLVIGPRVFTLLRLSRLPSSPREFEYSGFSEVLDQFVRALNLFVDFNRANVGSRFQLEAFGTANTNLLGIDRSAADAGELREYTSLLGSDFRFADQSGTDFGFRSSHVLKTQADMTRLDLELSTTLLAPTAEVVLAYTLRARRIGLENRAFGSDEEAELLIRTTSTQMHALLNSAFVQSTTPIAHQRWGRRR